MSLGTLSIFIGSSRESLPLVRVIERRLHENRRFKITAWTSLPKRAGDILLDSLITAATSYDAAVLVFGPDDLVISRGRKQKMPRDNVIFELGLFMGNLGRHRTIVLAPDESQANLKVISDIHNLNPITYSPPQLRKSMTSHQKSALLASKLRTAVEQLETHLEGLEQRKIFRGPMSVGMLTRDLVDIIGKGIPRSVRTIRNIALDMEQTWPTFRDDILKNESLRNIRIESLMIDWRSPAIRRMASETVDIDQAEAQGRRMVEYCREHGKAMEARKISFTCRAYSDVPLLHGFVVNQRRLMMSLCSVDDGKLVGSPNPYFAFEYPAPTSPDQHVAYLFRMFNAWFEHRWETARPIWPVR